MAETLTLMAVHAHPDDEASSTGGVLAAYSEQGIRTVVVTCTNGEFGDAPGGAKPGDDVPDRRTVSPEMTRQRAATEHRNTTTIDILPLLSRKRDALFAHASQIRESWFSKIPQGIADAAFGRESFIRAYDSTGAPVP